MEEVCSKKVSFWRILWLGRTVILTITLIFACVGAFYIYSLYDSWNGKYEVEFSYNTEVEALSIVSLDNIQAIKDSKENYAELDVTGIKNNTSISLENGVYRLVVKASFFPSDARAQTFMKDLINKQGKATYLNDEMQYRLIFSYNDNIDYNNILSEKSVKDACEALNLNYETIKNSLILNYAEKTKEVKEVIDGVETSKTVSYMQYTLYGNNEAFSSESEASTFLRLLASYQGEGSKSFSVINVYDKIDYGQIWPVTIVMGLIGLLISSTVVIVLGYKNPDSLKKKEDFYFEEELYRTPFTLKYWQSARKELSVLKKLITSCILVSVMLVCKLIVLPSGFGSLGISLGYLFFSVIGLLFGPFMAMIAGFLSDTIGFFIVPSGPFFIGYTINAILTGLIYGTMFYKTHVSFTKVLFARVLVNLVINVLLGSIWWGIISGFTYNQTMDYMLITSLPKNLVYLLPQSIVLFLVIKAVMPSCKRADLVNHKVAENVSLF